MNMNQLLGSPPEYLSKVQKKCQELGFEMASDEHAGSLLRTLIASKPRGKFLELGTGIGASLSWILDGMDAQSSVISIDHDPQLIDTVGTFFGDDPRLTLIHADGGPWIRSNQHLKFDLIFADAWPGKFFDLDDTLALLNPGGYYIIDDMLPASDWPAGHAEKVDHLLDYLASREDLMVTSMDWSTGIVICTKK